MLSWLKELAPRERKTLTASAGGWALDAMDVQAYTFVIPTLMAAWGISRGEAGILGTAALLFSAIGGWLTGVLSDRYGRLRMLQASILCYATFTFLSGFTTNFSQLFACRALQGLGFGGEWAAGMVLIGEVVQPRLRGRAVGFVQACFPLGWGLAALLFAALFNLLSPAWAWRAMFWFGLLPALLVFWIRREVTESDTFAAARRNGDATATPFSIFAPAYLRRTLFCALLCSGIQGGYYALTIWLPTFLNTTRHLSVTNTSLYLAVIIAGSWLGCIIGGLLADRIGRRPTFFLFAVSGVVVVFLYTQLTIGDGAMLLLGFPLGFCANAIFAPMGPFLSESFPTRVRATAQGFCFSAGRAVGALFPAMVGYLGTRVPLGQAMGLFMGGAYALVFIALLLLPETRGVDLAEIDTAAPPVAYKPKPAAIS